MHWDWKLNITALSLLYQSLEIFPYNLALLQTILNENKTYKLGSEAKNRTKSNWWTKIDA